MKKRQNECLFCTSRSCYEHVYSALDQGATYNEVCCQRHKKHLEKDADSTAPGVRKIWGSSTGKQSRQRGLHKIEDF